MGSYVFDLLKITAQSEIRVGASEVHASTHVLDLVPQVFTTQNGVFPYLPAEGLHGSYRSSLDNLFGYGENDWQNPAHPTAGIFGMVSDDGQRRGRLRFSHALPSGYEPAPVSIYTRNKLHPLLGTTEKEALLDELLIQEGYCWFFVRLYRAPDLEPHQIKSDLAYLDLVERAYQKGVLGMGSGRARGQGAVHVERVHRVTMNSHTGDVTHDDVKAYHRPYWLPSLFTKDQTTLTTPLQSPVKTDPTLLLVRLTNLGQLDSGRELIRGTQLFGALASLALELDGTVPEVRLETQPILVDLDHLFGARTDVRQAKAGGYFSRLYQAWKEGKFRLSPFLPTQLARNAEEHPLLYYNRCAQKIYKADEGYYYYDSQRMHLHHRRNRDTGTADDGSFRTTIEVRPCQDFVGFVRLDTAEVRNLFIDLLGRLPAGDLGFCKHTLLGIKFEAMVPAALQANLNGAVHLITPSLDSYEAPTEGESGARIMRAWTGLFPCRAEAAPLNGRRETEYALQRGWAVPLPPAPGRVGYRRNEFAVYGLHSHGPYASANPQALRRLRDGVAQLPEWNALGFGQVVYL